MIYWFGLVLKNFQNDMVILFYRKIRVYEVLTNL